MRKERKYPPDFNQLLKVLHRQKSDRPVLFEFFLNDRLYEFLAGEELNKNAGANDLLRIMIDAFYNAGYDYVTLPSWTYKSLVFDPVEHEKKKSISLNDGYAITDRADFEAFVWPDPEQTDSGLIEEKSRFLPAGMFFIPSGPGGVLENVISLVGFDRLCYMLFEQEDLAADIFREVGRRLLRFYELIAPLPSVGALIVNDDWGFKTQTMLDPESLRRHVFPWHERIVKIIHSAGKPAILHSCGNLDAVMDDVIDGMKFDAKHSWEDEIIPVEKAYDKWGKRIAILGGIDMDFLARSSPLQIQSRAGRLLNKTRLESYALGSGNSIPDFIPPENYLAMINCML
ncbi:MAG: uroporphyrinogen decarboxylase family protein [Bacteroidales bacterium]